MTQNPYLDQIRKEAYDESGEWKQRVKEIEEKEDYDLTEDDVREICDELYDKVKDACYFREEYIESLPDLHAALWELAAEWRERSNQFNRENRKEDGNFIRESFWSRVSVVAGDEAEKVQFIMEEYL